MADNSTQTTIDIASPSERKLNAMSVSTAPKRPTLWSTLKAPANDSGLLLEPEYHESFMRYKQAPTPEHASHLLTSLSPVLDEALRSYGGTEADSVTAKAKAKLFALEAIGRYDPARAKLRTHLLSHLRGLRRSVERSTSGVYVPEQWRIDSRHVNAAYTDARDELGREPSDAEIGDRIGMPVARVRKARGVPGVLASSQFDSGIASERPDHKAWGQWVEGIYHDLNPIDQVILEHSFGLHGRPVLAAGQIAEKVNLSPGAISQRKSRIQNMLDEYDTFLGRR